MALKRTNKVSAAFSMSSMTDIVFLLLIFFMVTSTLIAPNAIKVLLPQSNNQTSAKSGASFSITKDLKYFVNIDGKIKQIKFQDIEGAFQDIKTNMPETYVALHADKSIVWDEVVKVISIAKRNRLKMIIATAPERR
ncbi:biopolymer transporter ExbD [Puteibacter caeruleilacunae]|nr:biopolymer transporter ExbD [Puteibacter caeruleilacunae]